MTWCKLDSCHVVRRRRWVHEPAIHAGSHFDHEKRVAWVSISMHSRGSPVYKVMGFRLTVLRSGGGLL